METEKLLKQVNSIDVLMVIGDMNAVVGTGKSHTIGNHGLGKRDDRGERLEQFCIDNNLIIANTMFKQPKRRLYTWKSPGDIYRRQIDYIMIRKRFRNTLRQVRTYPGADIGSDHNPVVASVEIKLKRVKKREKYQPSLPDYTALKQKDVQQQFAIKVQNRYESLMSEGTEQSQEDNTNKEWKHLKKSIEVWH